MRVVMALAFVLAIDLFLFLGQFSVGAIGTANGFNNTNFYNYHNSTYSKYDTGSMNINGVHTLNKDGTTAINKLSSSASASTNTNFFEDVFNSIKNFFNDTLGLRYVTDIINGFPNLLQSMGLPEPLPFILGAFWHILTLFLLVLVITGRG